MLIERASSYEEVYGRFAWHLPERFNIAHAVCDRHARDPDRVALVEERDDGSLNRITFRAVQQLSSRLANTLAHYGLEQGDRVLLQLGQHTEAAITHVACWRAGLVSVPASCLFGPDAIEYRLNHCGARVLITDSANYPKVAEIRDRAETLETVLLVDGEADGALSFWDEIGKASERFDILPVTPDTPAFINYTSGTTGWPKGALHGHRTMLGHMPGLEMLLDFFPQSDDVMWSPADWSWLAGFMDVLMPAWFHGIPVVPYRAQGFDPEHALHLMAKHRVRTSLLTPTMLKMIRQVPSPERYDLNLRCILSGSEPVGQELHEAMGRILRAPINEAYGQTECNLILGNCSAVDSNRSGSLGRALPGHIMAIVSDEGEPLPDGEPGHIACRRPDPVMLLEYWRNPEATRDKFVGDWLMTGDTGIRSEDGFFWFQGRADDIIKSSGYRIGPGEIEDAILAHPSVAMSAVIGVPDPVRGEAVKAFVVLAPGAEPSEALKEEIRESVRGRLAKHEYPREIEFRDSLPMGVTGKILRRELRLAESAQDERAD